MKWEKMLAALVPLEEALCVVDLVILVEAVLVAMEIRAASLVEKSLHLLFEQVDIAQLVQEDQEVALAELAQAAQESLVVVQETHEAQNVWVVSATLVVLEAPKVQIDRIILQKSLIQAVLEDSEIQIMIETTVQAVLMSSEMTMIVVNGDQSWRRTISNSVARRRGHSIDDGEDETPICEVCMFITRCCRVAAAADGDATTRYSRK